MGDSDDDGYCDSLMGIAIEGGRGGGGYMVRHAGDGGVVLSTDRWA